MKKIKFIFGKTTRFILICGIFGLIFGASSGVNIPISAPPEEPGGDCYHYDSSYTKTYVYTEDLILCKSTCKQGGSNLCYFVKRKNVPVGE